MLPPAMELPPSDDTIAAIATAPAASAIGIVRLSGPRVFEIVRRLSRAEPGEPNVMALRKIMHPETGRTLDEVLLVVFRAPNSFTGEDMAEIHAHGNWTLLMDILDAMTILGARRAGPGEFTLRAFLNRKMDLARAESVADLIHARSEEGRRSAAEALTGQLSAKYTAWRDRILRWKALVEVSIDFSEDVGADETPPVLAADVENLRSEVDALIRTYRLGKVISEGVRIILAGSPNAGKSSLFNRLLREDRAIVHDEPGTTRDRIEEWCNLGKLSARLVDTAGIRSGVTGVEARGIERSRDAIGTGDIVLHVVDSAAGLTSDDREVIRDVEPDRRIGVWNKCDLPGSRPPPPEGSPWFSVSTVSGVGVPELVTTIQKRATGGLEPGEGLVIVRERHRDTLRTVSDCLGESASLMRRGVTPEIAAVQLQRALDALGELTGETTTEDVLGKIFSEFCIGK